MFCFRFLLLFRIVVYTSFIRMIISQAKALVVVVCLFAFFVASVYVFHNQTYFSTYMPSN